MTDWVKQIFENKIMSQLIVVLVVGMFAFYVGTVKAESNVNAEIRVVNIRLKAIEGEIALLKIKHDQICASVENKADKSLIESMSNKLDKYNNETNQRLDRIMELIINRNK